MEKSVPRISKLKQFAFDRTPQLVFFMILVLWFSAWVLGFSWEQLRTKTEQPINDIFLSVNTLFAGLAFFGIIWTSFTQYKDLKETKSLMASTAEASKSMAEASVRMAKHADEKTVLDFFQTYCSEYFQTVKDRSMNVLIASVRSSQYGDYLVSRLFAAGQLQTPSESFHAKVAEIPGWATQKEFLANERHDRYKLDELINFFSLLIGLGNAKDIINGCDFSYSWWRPLLWMIAIEQERRFLENEEVRTYATGLYLQNVVRRLDNIYNFKPFANYEDAWTFILNHPKIVEYGIDPVYTARHIQFAAVAI